MTAVAHPVVARDHCLAPDRVVDAPIYGGRYGRLFDDLPELRADEALLHGLGSAGGACDGAPFEAKGTDESRVAAGWPFFGQFVAHDITADRSPLTSRADPSGVHNFRTPRANLECVYGAGPVGSPYLFHRIDPARLLLGVGGIDVPRNAEGVALLGDPRNDVHLFVNQLHVAFLRLHNLLVDRLRAGGASESTLFDEARRAATWHYQWVLLRDFLPTVVGTGLAAELLAEGPRHYRPGDRPFIPFEFADAAYRYGHAQVRHRYRLAGHPGDGSGAGVPMFPDLMGFGPVTPDRAVDWSELFDLPGAPPAQRAKKIDGRLPSSLINLPLEITGEVEVQAYHSLAARDLQRGQATGLPSGEAVSRALGAEPLSAEEVGLADHGWREETPLWYYVLREADARHDGDRLGAVGGRIVGEVLVGIVDSDPESYRAVEPDWQPTLPVLAGGERFCLGDLLALSAGRS